MNEEMESYLDFGSLFTPPPAISGCRAAPSSMPRSAGVRSSTDWAMMSHRTSESRSAPRAMGVAAVSASMTGASTASWSKRW